MVTVETYNPHNQKLFGISVSFKTARDLPEAKKFENIAQVKKSLADWNKRRDFVRKILLKAVWKWARE